MFLNALRLGCSGLNAVHFARECGGIDERDLIRCPDVNTAIKLQECLIERYYHHEMAITSPKVVKWYCGRYSPDSITKSKYLHAAIMNADVVQALVDCGANWLILNNTHTWYGLIDPQNKIDIIHWLKTMSKAGWKAKYDAKYRTGTYKDQCKLRLVLLEGCNNPDIVTLLDSMFYEMDHKDCIEHSYQYGNYAVTRRIVKLYTMMGLAAPPDPTMANHWKIITSRK